MTSFILNIEQFRCLAHVVNISNISVMGHITKIAAVETSTAIWEYGSLDVIATIQTLTIKVFKILNPYFTK